MATIFVISDEKLKYLGDDGYWTLDIENSKKFGGRDSAFFFLKKYLELFDNDSAKIIVFESK